MRRGLTRVAALSFAALAACGGGRLDRQAFVEQAGAICRDVQDKLDRAFTRYVIAHGTPTPTVTPSPGASPRLTPEEHRPIIEVSLPINLEAEESFRALRVAPELRPALEDLLRELGASNAAQRASIALATSGDHEGFYAEQEKVSAANQRFRRQARTLQIFACSG